MWRMLVVLRRNLRNIKKSHRVADENMVGVGGGGGGGGNNNNNNNGGGMPIFIDRRRSRRGSWDGLSVTCSVVRAPLCLVSCFCQPHVNGADGVWVPPTHHEFAQSSEMNHLMVSDSMRYAILM